MGEEEKWRRLGMVIRKDGKTKVIKWEMWQKFTLPGYKDYRENGYTGMEMNTFRDQAVPKL